MRDMSYFTNIDPVDYDYAAQDTMKHLQFKDYKHLQGINFDNDREEPIWIKIMASILKSIKNGQLFSKNGLNR